METALKMTEDSVQRMSGEEEEGSWPELEQRWRPYVGAERPEHTVKDVNNMKKKKSEDLEMALRLFIQKGNNVPSPSDVGQPSYSHAQGHLLAP